MDMFAILIVVMGSCYILISRLIKYTWNMCSILYVNYTSMKLLKKNKPEEKQLINWQAYRNADLYPSSTEISIQSVWLDHSVG